MTALLLAILFVGGLVALLVCMVYFDKVLEVFVTAFLLVCIWLAYNVFQQAGF